MEYILVQHEGFKEEYLNQIKPLEGVSSDELVRRYNKEVDTGIVGIYALSSSPFADVTHVL